MKKLYNFLFLTAAFLCLIITANVFISFRHQYNIREDILEKKTSYTADEIMNIPSIPNIGVTGIPIAALQANYFFSEARFNEAVKLLNEATLVNRYLHFSDFMMAKYFMSQKSYDSVYYYSKKAFYGWPKNIEHYKMFNNILVRRKDTLEILQAFDSINKRFIDRSEYYNNFISSLADAKLRFMIVKYDSLQSIDSKYLNGKWKQAYEFETGEVNYLNNIINFYDNEFSNSSATYNYEIDNDTLYLFFKKSNDLVAKYPIYFSFKKNTLVLQNVPKYINMDSLVIQDQFFKKIK